MNALPGRTEELIRLEERLRWGGLDKADDLLNRIEAEMDAIEEEIKAAKDAGDTEAEEKAGADLDEMRTQWAEASEQRAVYADKLHQIRCLQDRIKAMTEGSGERPWRESPNGRCDNADLFYRLTRPGYPDGRVTEYSDDDVIRLIEKVVLDQQTVTVTFKAGVSVTLERGA